jgi:RHS repeat-associated protein
MNYTGTGTPIIDHLDYDGFGIVTNETQSSTGDRYKWTGREFDSETGLQYNRARYFLPGAGRWPTQDPMGFRAGDTNLYRYVHNSPEAATDPFGTQPPGGWQPSISPPSDIQLVITPERVADGYNGAFAWPITWSVQPPCAGIIIQRIEIGGTGIIYTLGGAGSETYTERFGGINTSYYEMWKVGQNGKTVDGPMRLPDATIADYNSQENGVRLTAAMKGDDWFFLEAFGVNTDAYGHSVGSRVIHGDATFYAGLDETALLKAGFHFVRNNQKTGAVALLSDETVTEAKDAWLANYPNKSDTTTHELRAHWWLEQLPIPIWAGTVQTTKIDTIPYADVILPQPWS